MPDVGAHSWPEPENMRLPKQRAPRVSVGSAEESPAPRKLALQKESRIEEGRLLLDHVHMMISIPPKIAVSQVIGDFKSLKLSFPTSLP
jgi:Transposase IS200 like